MSVSTIIINSAVSYCFSLPHQEVIQYLEISQKRVWHILLMLYWFIILQAHLRIV